MSTTTTAPNPCKIITGKVRASYAHLLEPTAIDEGQEKKYSVSLIIPKSDKKTIDAIKKGIEAAREQGKSKWGGKIPAKLKLPLRDGDEERPDDENYADAYFINATCKTKPGVVDKDLNPIMEADQIYSGMFVRASITLYPFDASGNRGIACGLNNIQKLADGDPLGGRSRAEDDFAEDFEDDDLL
jgi:hypothetical protein